MDEARSYGRESRYSCSAVVGSSESSKAARASVAASASRIVGGVAAALCGSLPSSGYGVDMPTLGASAVAATPGTALIYHELGKTPNGGVLSYVLCMRKCYTT